MGNLLADAFKEFRDPEGAALDRQFPVPTQVLPGKRRGKFVGLNKPQSSAAILDALPAEEGDQLHVVTPGKFVFCDLICELINRHGAPVSLSISTKSLNIDNATKLWGLMTKHPGLQFHLIVNKGFESSKAPIFLAVRDLLSVSFSSRFTMTIGQCLAKVVLIDYGTEKGAWVFEGSPNLCRSNNLEQLAVFRDRDLFEFHQAWMKALRDVRGDS